VMSGPVLTVALTRLRSDFDDAFPERSRSSDGWIGDSAHAESTSGHNPDDTSGVSAEYSDSDSAAEVRAIDVDKDLNSSTSMQDVVDRILATSNDLRRLKYVIFDRHQWSKSNGWKRTDYTGSNPHDQHAHFSGDPATDADGGQWSVALMGEDSMTDSQAYVQHIVNYRVDALVHCRTEVVFPAFTAPGGTEYEGYSEACQLGVELDRIGEQVDAILALLSGYQEPADSTTVAGTLYVTGGTLQVVETDPAQE
jgi:hypothetical protein